MPFKIYCMVIKLVSHSMMLFIMFLLCDCHLLNCKKLGIIISSFEPYALGPLSQFPCIPLDQVFVHLLIVIVVHFSELILFKKVMV